MAFTSVDSNPNKRKNVQYLNKDFSQFRGNLIDFAKTYFPDSYNDFNEASPGMMLIEMASYVGDVLSYYLDDTLKESLLGYAQERKSIYNLAQFFGYKITPITPAKTRLNVYQIIPSIGTGATIRPDYSYALTIKEGMEVESKTDPSVRFRTEIPIDFTYSSSYDSTEVSVYGRDSSNAPTFYLIRKQVDAIAGVQKTQTFSIGDATPYMTLTLDNKRVVGITSIIDDDNNKYYEVPFLAQDFVFVDYPNVSRYDDKLAPYRDSVPFLLRLLKTPRRFVTRLREDGNVEIQFGSGTSEFDDQVLIPNPKNIGLGTNAKALSSPIDPQNFFTTKTYGQAPSNTTLTVSYIEGGGLSSNVAVDDLTRIRRIEFEDFNQDVSIAQNATLTDLKETISVTNAVPATGGRNEEPLDNIRNDALAWFASQGRAVTKRDYEIRALSMPPRFGSISKVFVVPDGDLDLSGQVEQNQQLAFNSREKNNPFAINMYILGYDKNKHLTTVNQAIKQNLKTYLSEFRMVTDGINILDGFIVNIGVDFAITTFQSFNKQEVLLKAVNKVKSFFEADKWTFNQPINLSELELEIAAVEGVSSVQSVSLRNLVGGLYGPFSYDMDAARRIVSSPNASTPLGKIIYPSLDPCIFEVKYPSKDIRGRCV